MKLPCVIFEDEHLLVLNKPAGLNTHAPGPFAGEGLYDWLRHREPRWASLAIIHRLDKETSGLIVFSKTPVANRSLTEQFTHRRVRKRYILLTDRTVSKRHSLIRTALVRAGDKYVSRPVSSGSLVAETRFELPERALGSSESAYTTVSAEPLTGRTHQIRVHAAELGFPILGDARYGGTSSPRLCLHASELAILHPVSGEELVFRAVPEFSADPALALRAALIDPQTTTAFRIAHGASDALDGCYAEVLGSYLLSQSAEPVSTADKVRLTAFAKSSSVRGGYHKHLSPNPAGVSPERAAPYLEFGSPAPERFTVLENGLRFELSFSEGYSVGLFLDQRDNRHRILTGHVAADFPLFESSKASHKPEVLNAFAYTCGFSVCAAKAGCRATSLDLSKKYLEWGKRNFQLNQLAPAEHDFIYGDVFDWFRRLEKKKRTFDVILLDPPTFSRSKHFGPFRASKDYRKLIELSLPLLNEQGVLFASTNTADWPAQDFLNTVRDSAAAAGRPILREHYFPQPPDFPISRAEPAYLKTVWLRVQ